MSSRYLLVGGTGTLGRACARRLLQRDDVEWIGIVSRDEQKQEQMARDFPDERLRFFIGDVRDKDRLALACRGAEVIISAAALKIVPALEFNPFEALETNVRGAAQNVITAALNTPSIEKVIYVSSDKACCPVNAYGVSKAMGERLIVSSNAYSGSSGPRMSAVRYGNVAGSRGSVIPLWRGQLSRGEPLTLTSIEMTRYWMRIEQAVQFVVDALERMKGGEVFVPELRSFRVEQLATVMLTQAGRTDYTMVGLRPGEKLHERLIVADEARRTFFCPGFGYVLTREPDLLTRDARPDDGRLVPEGFGYDSETNELWMSDQDLLDELEVIP